MAFVKKEWKDRLTEYPNRRLLTKEDGSTELVTVSREEGMVSEEGDAFNGANMNGLEERIAAAVPYTIVIDDEAGTVNFIDAEG